MGTDEQEKALRHIIIVVALTIGVGWLLGERVEVGSRHVASHPPVVKPGEDPGEPPDPLQLLPELPPR
jgi:hypothetical protein